MQIMAVTPLKKYRLELGYKQQDFAVMSGLRINTYQNAERGHNTSYSTAKRILDSLNTSRIARQMEPVSMDDLGLTIV
jgi:transcriptional regulator with XRE-family HTH domain